MTVKNDRECEMRGSKQTEVARASVLVKGGKDLIYIGYYYPVVVPAY